MPFAEVIFNISIPHSFTYHIPQSMLLDISQGRRVLAPLGTRQLSGIITEVKQNTKFDRCKDIIDILDEKPLVSLDLLDLTQWISEYYLTSWGQAVQLALPKGLEQKSKQFVYPNDDPDINNDEITERQRHLYDIIVRDPGKNTIFYREKFGYGSFYYLLQNLKQKNIIFSVEKKHPEKVKKLHRKFVTISHEIQDNIKGFKKAQEVQNILHDLKGESLLLTDFMKRTGFSSSRINKMADNGLILIDEKEVYRTIEYEYNEKKQNIVLNPEQVHCLTTIKKSIEKQKFIVHLLHGVTGSGKTQIYLEAIQIALLKGKSAIVLIPEISLTPQTVRRFENFFPGRIAVFHSKMSLGERYDAWRRVYDQEFSIVVGPRSALFMPLKNVGIIVVDEEHDSSYKQSSSNPRYHARDVAIYRARMNNAVVVLGSATPSLESYHNVKQKKYNLLEINKRISDFPLPKVHLIDIKGNTNKESNSKILSSVLIDKIENCLNTDKQIILLQNRRGFSSFLQCSECGFIIKCPNCEITLTYHSYHSSLVCHYCGYNRKASSNCPKCDGVQIKYLGTGTQKIEKELKRLFPNSRTLRMDLDTTSARGSHDRILQAFNNREADILLGTQMIAKGLDFENVTLVGVISADIGLTLPDYRASERVFQLLTQVAGRSGRGDQPGEVVIQSFLTSHYAIQYARNHDFKGFYSEEIKHRKELNYPPFTRMINIRISGPELPDTIALAREISTKLKKVAKPLFQVIGPAPAPISKIKNMYRWQIFIKVDRKKDPACKKSKSIMSNALQSYFKSNKNDFNIAIDVDPIELI